MVAAKKRFDLNKDQQNSFCLEVDTHPMTSPARPGITSELSCLPSLFLPKFHLKHAAVFSISSNVHFELIIVSSTGCSTSLPILANTGSWCFKKRSRVRGNITLKGDCHPTEEKSMHLILNYIVDRFGFFASLKFNGDHFKGLRSVGWLCVRLNYAVLKRW